MGSALRCPATNSPWPHLGAGIGRWGQGVGGGQGNFQYKTKKGQMIFQGLNSKQRKRKGAEWEREVKLQLII